MPFYQPLNFFRAVWGRLRGTDEDAAAIRKQRFRKKLTNKLYTGLPVIRILLFLIGYAWMLLLPSSQLTTHMHVDENALQPGQVQTYYGWSDVHAADTYLSRIETLYYGNASHIEKASALKTMFTEQGIPAATQSYSFIAGKQPSSGINTYAVLAAPRSSGAEAMVIAASWESLKGGPNLRGIAFVLSLAGFVKNYSLWSKDLIFVISDGYMDGMQAWLGAYHGVEQSNLKCELITLHSGVIWTALAVDYPGHSFSHLGVFYEGLNGRLPNQDLLNSFNIISSNTGGTKVILYDSLQDGMELPLPAWLSDIVGSDSWRDYMVQARNILKHVSYQAFGRASGIHGLFHRFRIDAITIFALPASGPHGFYSMGRIVESTLRTMNNLLERLHASLFFYIMKSPNVFLKIGQYLPSAVLISVAMMFGGLRLWIDAGWFQSTSPSSKLKPQAPSPAVPKWETRQRSVLMPLAIMAGTHVIGGVIFLVATSTWWISLPAASTSYFGIIPFSLITLSCLSALLTIDFSDHPKKAQNDDAKPSPAPLYMLLKSFNLCLASTVISITTVLNFSMAASLAVLLGVPLSISSPTKSLYLKLCKAIAYHLLLVPVWFILFSRPMSQSVWDWQVLGVWYSPFVLIVYLPLVLQVTVVCMLDPEFYL